MYFSYVSYPSNCWLSTKLLTMINYYVNAELTVASKEVPRIGWSVHAINTWNARANNIVPGGHDTVTVCSMSTWIG
jgi:hypothetical protein